MEIELKEINILLLAPHILGFWDSRKISLQDISLSFLLG